MLQMIRKSDGINYPYTILKIDWATGVDSEHIVFKGKILVHGKMRTDPNGRVVIDDCQIRDFGPNSDEKEWSMKELITEYRIHHFLEFVPDEEKEAIRELLQKHIT